MFNKYNRENTPSTNISAKNFNKIDGKEKKISLRGATMYESSNNAAMATYEERIKYYLDSEGDMIIIHISFYKGCVNGYFSSNRTLKDCAMQQLKEVFGLRNSSALRNLKAEEDVLHFPLLINGKSAELTAVKYSYAKSHPEMFNQLDFTEIESAKSFTDKALESLSESENAIIYDCFHNPKESKVYKYDTSDSCDSNFIKLCVGVENEFEDNEKAKIEYPNSEDLYDEREEEGVFERGNVMTFWLNNQMQFKITMHLSED